MATPLLSHREGLLRKSRTIRNHASTVISIQAVSQLLESLYRIAGNHLTEEGRTTITVLWDYLDSDILTDIVKTGVRARFNANERSDSDGVDKGYSTRFSGGKILTVPSDIILFAKQHGHLATGITPPILEIQIENTVPQKSVALRYNASNHDKRQQNTLDWIEDVHFQSNAFADLYTELPSKDWFRLLVIEPGTVNDALKCQLLPMELEMAVSRYEALSYCWKQYNSTWWSLSKSEKLKLEGIICNGSKVQITPNLGEALLHIRHPGLRRVIWVDALCINQNNEKERSQQVSIMGSIYKNASRTLIWAGNTANPESGLHRICQIVNSWDGRKPANFSFFDPETGRIHYRQPTTDLKNIPESKLMQALRNVFDYRWFNRRWVIQEVVLAKSVDLLIGHFSISWTWIGLAAALLRTRYSHLISNSINSSTRVIQHAMNAYFMFRLSPGYDVPALDIELLTLLRLASSFENSNPLDAIYALRGLIEQVKGIDILQHIKVDYSMAEDQLLMNIADLLFRSKRAPLDFLSDAGTEPIIPKTFDYWSKETPRKGAGATWIPRWTPKSRPLLDLWAVDERFDSSFGLPCQRLVSRSPMHIAVKGILVSTAIWRGDVLVFPLVENGAISNPRPTSRSILSLIQSGAFIDKNSASSDQLFSPEVLETFARVLTAGRDSRAKLDTSKSANLSSFAAFLHLLLEKKNNAEYSTLSNLAGNTEPGTFLQVAQMVTLNRTLFVTSQGHLGLGPVEMRAGDQVCIFGGASMPFILRKVVSSDDTENLFNLIGECYIDGIMDGQIVEAMKEKRNHYGPFVPQILLETLYEYPSLRQEGKEMMKKFLDETRQLSEQAHQILEVSTIELQ